MRIIYKLCFLLCCKGLFAAANSDGSYGGDTGNDVFQTESVGVVRCMEKILSLKECDFDDAVGFAVSEREKIAKKTHSRDASHFGVLCGLKKRSRISFNVFISFSRNERKNARFIFPIQKSKGLAVSKW